MVIAVAALCGCAAPQISLTKQAQAKIDRAEGILIIPQNSLEISVRRTEPGNTGAIGALIAAGIDNIRQSRAEKAAAPMYEPLRDFDFRKVMLDAANAALARSDNVKFSVPLRTESVDSDSTRKSAYDQLTASALLFINVGYRLEDRSLIVTAKAELYPKAEALKQFRNSADESNPLDSGNAIYRKKLIVTKRPIRTTNIKESLSEAATDIALQLAVDLNKGI